MRSTSSIGSKYVYSALLILTGGMRTHCSLRLTGDFWTHITDSISDDETAKGDEAAPESCLAGCISVGFGMDLGAVLFLKAAMSAALSSSLLMMVYKQPHGSKLCGAVIVE